MLSIRIRSHWLLIGTWMMLKKTFRYWELSKIQMSWAATMFPTIKLTSVMFCSTNRSHRPRGSIERLFQKIREIIEHLKSWLMIIWLTWISLEEVLMLSHWTYLNKNCCFIKDWLWLRKVRLGKQSNTLKGALTRAKAFVHVYAMSVQTSCEWFWQLKVALWISG